MSHEDIVAKIQRMAREKYEKEHNESVTAAVKLKAEKDAEIEKEKKRKELKQAIEDDLKKADEAEKRNKAAKLERTRYVPFEYAETNPKYYPTPHGYIGEFIVETKVMSDKRIRFSPPAEIKKELKKGQKVKLEVRLLSD